MANIQDVSKKAGVSTATVSHVINGTRYVSDEVKDRVIRAMRDLNYQPNYIARTLRVGKSNTIGIIIPDTRNPYFTEVALYIEQVAYNGNYSVIICNTENSPERELNYINVLVQKQVDGIVFITCGNNKASIDRLVATKIPFVFVDREPYYKTDATVVMTDNYQGAVLAVDYMIGLGHKRIACITGKDEQHTTSDNRKRGFIDALHRNGIEVDEALMAAGDFSVQSGYEAGLSLLSLSCPPSAIFAFNDLMALGVLRAADERGFKVPRDLTVIGYDNIELSSYCYPLLTTISQPKQEIANKVFEILQDMMQGNKSRVSSIMFCPELVIRKSSCAAMASMLPDR